MYNKARLNAEDFFKGNENCIIKKSPSFDRNVDLLPSDEEYPIILKEAQNQIDSRISKNNPYASPDYEKMREWVNYKYRNINYIGGALQGNIMTHLNATKAVKVEPWCFVYKGIEYFAYVNSGLIYEICINDERVCSNNFFGNSECYLDDKTTLESIHQYSIERVESKKKDEIKRFKKELYELRKEHKERMDELTNALNGKELIK